MDLRKKCDKKMAVAERDKIVTERHQKMTVTVKQRNTMQHFNTKDRSRKTKQNQENHRDPRQSQGWSSASGATVYCYGQVAPQCSLATLCF